MTADTAPSPPNHPRPDADVPERVPTVRLGRTGVQVPRVSLGTWAYGGENQVGDLEADPRVAPRTDLLFK
jgi:hypothetical protein